MPSSRIAVIRCAICYVALERSTQIKESRYFFIQLSLVDTLIGYCEAILVLGHFFPSTYQQMMKLLRSNSYEYNLYFEDSVFWCFCYSKLVGFRPLLTSWCIYRRLNFRFFFYKLLSSEKNESSEDCMKP